MCMRGEGKNKEGVGWLSLSFSSLNEWVSSIRKHRSSRWRLFVHPYIPLQIGGSATPRHDQKQRPKEERKCMYSAEGARTSIRRVCCFKACLGVVVSQLFEHV